MAITYVRIPQNRVGALIGPEGSNRRELEERSGVRLRIDSKTGEVAIDDSKAFEPVLALKVRDVVRAIGRGFAPDRALRLFQDDTFLEILDITDYVGKNEKSMGRVRSRIIGAKGKTRETIEDNTGTSISVLGKTVAILGDIQEVVTAREAVEMLLNGASHGSVYGFLARKRKELRLHDLGLD